MSDCHSELVLEALASEPHRRQAINKYHYLLERCQLADYANRLQDDLRSHEVLYGDRLVCPFLRPSFITKAQLKLLTWAVAKLTGAMQTLVPVILQDKPLQDFLGITPAEKQLIDIEPGYKGISVSSRLDGFLNGGSLGFVEYNAESPAGIGYGDCITRAFCWSEIVAKFAEDFPYTTAYCSEKLLDALLDCYRQFGGKDKPNIAIVDLDLDHIPTQHEFAILQRSFQEAGYSTIIADPRNLEYANEQLSYQGTRIDILYRRVLTGEFLEQFESEQALYQAYLDHRVCMVNNFRAKILHKKTIFAVLTDPAYHHMFTSEQIDCITSHVPWTRRLSAARTISPKGRECDLLHYVRHNHEKLVLKPNDSYGGRGIYLGWELTQHQWDQAIDVALEGDYLVQVRVDVEREHFPIWDGREAHWAEYTLDLDPFVFGGQLAGITTRLSASQLCNVTAGGGAVPSFVV